MKTSDNQNFDLNNDRSASSETVKTSETQNFEIANEGSTASETVPESPRRGRPWLWLLMAVLLAGGGFAAWRMLRPAGEAPAANAQPQETRVKLLEVQTATIQDSSEYIANLDSRRSVNLLPQIEGHITRIFVRAGDQVTQGTPIMEVDPDEQQAAVNSATAAAAAAQAEVEQARATVRSLEADRLSNLSQLKLSQQQYERYSTLANQGAVPRDTADQYLNQFEAARSGVNAIEKEIEAQQATVAQAEKELQQAQANIKEQQAQLDYYQIAAPFDGTVGDIPVKLGDFVNTSTQLTNITQNRPLEVEISIPIERSPQLRTGMPVEILDGQGRLVGISRIFFISPNTANNTQSVLIKSLFENSRDQLRADQYVRARVIWDQREGVLIPTTAVTRLGGETFVYVAEKQAPSQQGQTQQGQSQKGQTQQEQPKIVARQRAIDLGAIQGNNYQVLEGLKPGERIVVSGLLNLSDGAVIIPE